MVHGRGDSLRLTCRGRGAPARSRGAPARPYRTVSVTVIRDRKTWPRGCDPCEQDDRVHARGQPVEHVEVARSRPGAAAHAEAGACDPVARAHSQGDAVDLDAHLLHVALALRVEAKTDVIDAEDHGGVDDHRFSRVDSAIRGVVAGAEAGRKNIRPRCPAWQFFGLKRFQSHFAYGAVQAVTVRPATVSSWRRTCGS